MPGNLLRVVLAAALLVGLIAMHSFGHGGHGGDPDGQVVVTAHSAHHGHAMAPEAADESGTSPLISLLGFVVCGALIARIVIGFFRSGAWSRLWDRVVAAMRRPGREGARRRVPPGPRPASLRIHRIAVLRI